MTAPPSDDAAAAPAPRGEVTHLLRRMGAGDPQAPAALLPLLYRELHGIAKRHMAGERGDHTLQPTALIHEAYLRLLGPAADGQEPAPGESSPDAWRDRGHFLRAASRVMRNILVDHARARTAAKHGGSLTREPFDDALLQYEQAGHDLLAVHGAVGELAAVDPGLEEVVDMHFFAGLTFAEIAAALAVTERTVYRRWCLARAWLRGAIVGDADPGPARGAPPSSASPLRGD
jgi:RNA polymerase sigma factor (TIGR02999 family)